MAFFELKEKRIMTLKDFLGCKDVFALVLIDFGKSLVAAHQGSPLGCDKSPLHR